MASSLSYFPNNPFWLVLEETDPKEFPKHSSVKLGAHIRTVRDRLPNKVMHTLRIFYESFKKDESRPYRWGLLDYMLL